MSEEASSSWCCASCGIAEIDDVKLRECDGCDLVRYCSDECKQDHKSQHEEECKKRAAELRDELLFKQPESTHMGDCPICSVPLPIEISKYAMNCCCSKEICIGCVHANEMRDLLAGRQKKCPFCRHPMAKSHKEANKLRMKRVAANDPAAICYVGVMHHRKGHNSRAFDHYSKAAALGLIEAHFKLALLYLDGEGVEKDWGKGIHHLEEAAIGGHPGARYNLGVHENNSGNGERSVKHLMIAAKQGHDGAIKMLMEAFKWGYLEKEELAAALRAQKAAVDETKSLQRAEAEEFYRKNTASILR